MPPITIKKKPGPKATACPWCGSTTCRCCRCSGFAGCKHAPGEPCSKPRYRRRRLCNPCEKSRLQTIKKMKAEGLIHKDVGHCMNKNLRDFLRTHSASSTSTQVQNRVRSIQSLQKHSSSLINMKSKSMPETTSDHWSSVLENGDSSLTMSLEEEIRLIGLPSVTGSSEEVPDSRSITSTSSDENVSSSDLWEQDDKTMNDRVISVDLNIKGNKTPFARVPLNRDVDSLRYIRDYIGNRLKLSDLLTCEKSNSTSVKFSYNFLSQHGVRIHLSQEREILAMSQVVTRKTRNSERSHIFIVLNNTEMPPPSLPSRKRHREDDEDNDDGNDDDHDDNDSDNFNRKLTKRFHGAPRSVQSRLALEYIQSQLSNSSSSEQLSSSDQGSGAFLRDTDSLLIVATSRNMLEVVRSLLRMGTDVNERSNTTGDTALHIATRLGHVDILKTLLRESLTSPVGLCGCFDVDARNNSGQTVLDIANQSKSPHRVTIRNLLKTYMTESVISTLKFRMPTHSHTLAQARNELMRVARQNGRRMAPFLFVAGSSPGILVRPHQERDFTLEQLSSASGFVRVRVYRKYGVAPIHTKPSEEELSALRTLASLATTSISSVSTTTTTMKMDEDERSGTSALLRISSFGPSEARIHVAQAAKPPSSVDDVVEEKEEKNEKEEAEKNSE